MILETVNFIAPMALQAGLASGEYVRMGTIIKDVTSGTIVGHMKEVGNLSNVLSSIPLGIDPLSNIANVYQGIQLEQIKESLETLQLISTVGATASVATLGVSVVGFAAVLNKLDKLDKKLDGVLNEISRVKEIVLELQEDQNLLKISEVEFASQQLSKAIEADSNERRRELLTNSNNIFTKYKIYYLKLAQYNNLWEDNLLPIDIAHKIYSRYVTCALGEMYSELLLGDLSVTYKTWETINKELKSISNFDKISIFRTHHDALIENQKLDNNNLNNLKSQIKFTQEMIDETTSRIDSLSYEIKYLENKKIEPIEYIRQLKSMDDGIVIISA